MSLIRSSTANSNNFRSPRGIEEIGTPRRTKANDKNTHIFNARADFHNSNTKTRPQSSNSLTSARNLNVLIEAVRRLQRDDVIDQEARHQFKQQNTISGGLSLSNIGQTQNTSKCLNFEEGNSVDKVNSEQDEIHRTPAEDMFIFAVTRGHIEDAKQLLNTGVNIEICNDFHRDATQIAARNGNVPMLKLLSHFGANMKYTRGFHGDTLFHLAAANGHVAALKYLHSVGASPDLKDNKGQTSVHVAARRCELQVLNYFHDALNIDFSVVDNSGYKPIDLVPRYGYDSSEACRKLILSATGQTIADIILSERTKKRSGLISSI